MVLKSGLKNPYIDVKLTAKNKKIDFIISNNLKEITNHNYENYKGIGLKNIQENLALIYPHNHHFLIKNNKNVFTVQLTIDLKK